MAFGPAATDSCSVRSRATLAALVEVCEFFLIRRTPHCVRSRGRTLDGIAIGNEPVRPDLTASVDVLDAVPLEGQLAPSPLSTLSGRTRSSTAVVENEESSHLICLQGTGSRRRR